MPDSGKPVLDLARLREIYEDDTAGMLELYDMMLRNTAGHMANLEAAVAEKDLPAIRKACHSVKGSSGNVGAMELCTIAAQAEDAARDGDFEGAQPHITALPAAFERVREAVERFRKNPEG